MKTYRGNLHIFSDQGHGKEAMIYLDHPNENFSWDRLKPFEKKKCFWMSYQHFIENF